jgi:hypothetical protein
VRTAIFLGLLYVGDAIGNQPYMETDSNIVEFMGIAVVVFIVMDIVDLFRNKKPAN